MQTTKFESGLVLHFSDEPTPAWMVAAWLPHTEDLDYALRAATEAQARERVVDCVVHDIYEGDAEQLAEDLKAWGEKAVTVQRCTPLSLEGERPLTGRRADLCYSLPLVPDRQALGRFTYQLRKFGRELAAMEIPEPYRGLLRARLAGLEDILKNARVDYGGDGSLLDPESTDNESLRKRLGE